LKYDYGSQHLQNWVESYNLVKDPQWPDCQSINDFKNLPGIIKKECTEIHKIDTDNFIKNTGGVLITDENNVGVNVEYAEHFWTGPLKYSGNNQFDVYNSNPTTAHNTCHSKFCYNLIKGKLYKCHHVALLPEFMEQFHVNMTSKDIDLLTSYKALEATQPIDEILQFIENLPKEIPQCKFCPESLDTVLLKSSTKKIKILKRSKIP
jgi:hypothetical protein